MRSDGSAPTAEPVRLAELVASFSLASDLGTGMPMEWAVRSCVIAIRLGEAIGAELTIIGGSGQTVDWGNQMATMRHMVRHVGEDQSPLRRARMLAGFFAAGREVWAEGSRAHCEVARRLSERLGVAGLVQLLLAQVFERWDGRGRPDGLKGEVIAPPVRVAQLARDVEIFHCLHGLDAAVALA